VASIVGQWAKSNSISQYGSISIDKNLSALVFTEKPNIYRSISETLDYIVTVTLIPLSLLFYINPYLVGFALELTGPIIVFFAWFIILYIATYLYAKFVKKNLTAEAKNHGLLIKICVLTTIFLTAAWIFIRILIT
jgi:hypothetical protein